MIDHDRTTVFRFDVPHDYIQRKHRYLVYSMKPKRLLFTTYKLNDMFHFINDHSDASGFVVTSQYLGKDCHFYPFERTYYYMIDNQLSLFNQN